jgi:hypothetical protein
MQYHQYQKVYGKVNLAVEMLHEQTPKVERQANLSCSTSQPLDWQYWSPR